MTTFGNWGGPQDGDARNPLPARDWLPDPGPQRIGLIRRRIMTGFYDRSEVVRETARRILDAGDLPGAQ